LQVLCECMCDKPSLADHCQLCDRPALICQATQAYIYLSRPTGETIRRRSSTIFVCAKKNWMKPSCRSKNRWNKTPDLPPLHAGPLPPCATVPGFDRVASASCNTQMCRVELGGLIRSFPSTKSCHNAQCIVHR